MSQWRAGEVVQLSAVVTATHRDGDYQHLTFDAPGVPALARPGQFVALTVGGPTSGLLLRRSFSIHRVRSGEHGESLEVVIADAGPGTHWLTRLVPGQSVDLIGPLGRGFPMPPPGTAAILLGGGYGSAPLFWLAEELGAQGSPATIVLGAATADRLFGATLGAGSGSQVVLTTDDGSAGRRGLVTDPLPELIAGTGAGVVYACGPMGMLRAVTECARAAGITAHVAVEEAMACGIGVCMTCVLPVVGDDGLTRMIRSCLDGPVLDGARVRWDAIADGRVAVPHDALGAPAGARP